MNSRKLANLLATKNQLAEKYDRLAKLASSAPKRATFRRQSANFKHQARMLEIKAKQ